MQDETTIDIHYCGKCIQTLENYGLPALETFQTITEICIIFSSSYAYLSPYDVIWKGNLEFLELKNKYTDMHAPEIIIDFLEEKGFVQTVDHIDHLFNYALTRGIRFDGEKYLVCSDDSHEFK